MGWIEPNWKAIIPITKDQISRTQTERSLRPNEVTQHTKTPQSQFIKNEKHKRTRKIKNDENRRIAGYHPNEKVSGRRERRQEQPPSRDGSTTFGEDPFRFANAETMATESRIIRRMAGLRDGAPRHVFAHGLLGPAAGARSSGPAQLLRTCRRSG